MLSMTAVVALFLFIFGVVRAQRERENLGELMIWCGLAALGGYVFARTILIELVARMWG